MSKQRIISHDTFFKQSFGIKKVIVDLMESRLPKEILHKIDQESIQLMDKNFTGIGGCNLVYQATIKKKQIIFLSLLRTSI